MKWSLLKVLACIAFPFAAEPSFAADSPSPERYNLLWITADDLNGDSMGWTGSTVGATPNIDRFAADCFQFHQLHVTVPICQPSRSAFMTGRVPHRNGALGFHPINKGTPTSVSLLQKAGYFAAVMNKHEHMKPDAEFPWEMKLNGSGKNPPLFGEQMQEALVAAKQAERPFFINANITDPHRPFPGGAPKKVVARSAKPGAKRNAKKAADGDSDVAALSPEKVVVPAFLEDVPDVRCEVAQYFAGVRRMDQSFAAIMTALDASGQGDRTIVVFHSDHGMSFPFSKATLWRNGPWTPTLIRLPSELTKKLGGSRIDETSMVSSVDLLPTLLELLGVQAPGDLDGRSLVPLMRGETQADRDFVITHVNSVSSGQSFAGRCIRSLKDSYVWYPWVDGKRQLKVEAMSGLSMKALLAAAESDEKIAARVAQYHDGTREGFFDLTIDPDERRNLINEVNRRERIKELKQTLLEHMRKTSDPLSAEFEKLD